MRQELDEKIQSILNTAFLERVEDIKRELSEQLQNNCGSLLEAAVAQACDKAARESRTQLLESLSNAVRRIRNEETVTAIAATLVDAASQFCGRCALFIHKQDRVMGFKAKGFQGSGFGDAFQKLATPLSQAAAIGHSIETRDTVVCGGSANELSQEIVNLFELKNEVRAHLFPVTLRDSVLAVLYADSGLEQKSAVDSTVIEILTASAEAWIEAIGTRKKKAAEMATV